MMQIESQRQRLVQIEEGLEGDCELSFALELLGAQLVAFLL